MIGSVIQQGVSQNEFFADGKDSAANRGFGSTEKMQGVVVQVVQVVVSRYNDFATR